MKRRPNKSIYEKAMDKNTTNAFAYACSGIPVPVLDLEKIYTEGRRLQLAHASHTELCAGIKTIALKLAKAAS